MYVRALPERCCGCQVCEVVCSLWHRDVINHYRSGIRIDKKNIREDVQTVCSHGHRCALECVAACAFDAMHEKNGVVSVDYDNCVGCRACERACPLLACWVFEKKAYKCDLCGGDPQCVKYCSQDALEVVP
jgi:Fe-S-cluster-containing hydrogenase component 2